jgi:hypothetical protein
MPYFERTSNSGREPGQRGGVSTRVISRVLVHRLTGPGDTVNVDRVGAVFQRSWPLMHSDEPALQAARPDRATDPTDPVLSSARRAARPMVWMVNPYEIAARRLAICARPHGGPRLGVPRSRVIVGEASRLSAESEAPAPGDADSA